MVRAVILKHIRGSFDVREEADGEAGWQALLLDPSIHVVITDHTMPKLDGFQLIERIRASRIKRIRELPVVMISGDEDAAARERAKALGATDFITKGIGTADLLSRLDVLVNLSRGDQEVAAAPVQAAADDESGILTRAALLGECTQAMARAGRDGEQVTVMLIGVDGFDEVRRRHGESVAAKLLQHYSAMLARSIRRGDSLARWVTDVFAILSPNAPLRDANSFALRLREAVETASVHIGEQALRLTVSIGIANERTDAVEDAAGLLDLAATRMQLAIGQGGNRVVGANNVALTRPAAAESPGEQSIDRALASIETGHLEAVRPQLEEISRRLQPLLRVLESEHLILKSRSGNSKRLGGNAAPANDNKN